MSKFTLNPGSTSVVSVLAAESGEEEYQVGDQKDDQDHNAGNESLSKTTNGEPVVLVIIIEVIVIEFLVKGSLIEDNQVRY